MDGMDRNKQFYKSCTLGSVWSQWSLVLPRIVRAVNQAVQPREELHVRMLSILVYISLLVLVTYSLRATNRRGRKPS